MLHTEQEIKVAYAGSQTAERYREQRFLCELNRLLHDRQVAAVTRLVEKHRPPFVLEIAPGPGRITREIRTASQLTCLEFNSEMIRIGKEVCPNSVRWVQGNAFQLPLGREFDLAYTFRFIRHFHREDRNRLYGQIRKVLQPGGMLMFDAVNGQVSGPLRKAHPEDYPIYDKLYGSEQELRSELSEAGFEVTDVECVQRWYSAQSRAQVLLGPRSRLLCRLAIRTLERLRRGPALEWIVTCRRA